MFRSPRAARTDSPARLPDVEIVWRCSQHTVWTATQATRLCGLVEEHGGTYIATDEVTGTFNTYRTLSEAMEALESPQ